MDQYTHHYKFGDVTWHREGTFTEEEGHATDLIANEAVEFLRSKRDKDRPFFLYVPFTVPHYPLQEPETWTAPYNDAIENESRRLYAASMTHMDDAVGKILAALEVEGIEENTLVIFSSDNGGQEQWQGGADQYDGRHGPNDVLGDNRPLRGWKGGLYEGGIRVPAAVRWPGHLAPGVFDQPMMIQDLLPTIAGLAGAQSPSSVEGTPLEERPFYWRTGRALAVRQGRWKLIHHGRTLAEGNDELFDLVADPNEKMDLAAKEPAVLKRLWKSLEAQASADAPIPPRPRRRGDRSPARPRREPAGGGSGSELK